MMKHIAIVAPGRSVPQVMPENLMRLLNKHNLSDQLKIDFHPQCFLSNGHSAGTDSERAAAFIETANDPAYDAIWFPRGGYGACRIIDSVDQLTNAARKKTYLGYSDAGFLLAGLYNYGFKHVVHGPMPIDMVYDNGEEGVLRAAKYLAGDLSGFESTCGNKPVIAFNLSVLHALLGTPYMPDLTGHIVMIEDTAEYDYRTDRHLFGLMNNGAMKNVAGIMMGRFGGIPENDVKFSYTTEEMFKYWCEKAHIPYLGHADIGHDADNKIVPFG